MNDCCDWNAICLNEKEVIHYENKPCEVYLSFCKECLSLTASLNNSIINLNSNQYDYLKIKYKDKI